MLKIIFVTIFVFLDVLSSKELITPIPDKITDVDPQKAELGKRLFFDPILSKDGTIACVSCHIISAGGDDDRKVSIGINGSKGLINSPTVLNSRYNFVQFWNGRAKDLKEQAQGPITSPMEMGNSFENLIKTLNKTSYKKEFKKIYKEGITKNSIVDAIAEYEKTLVTPDSRFDLFLKGKKDSLNDEEKRGYLLFKSKGCIACHNGINLGSNMYAYSVSNSQKSEDLGRYSVTKNELDKYLFKVPTLRNIELTAPYLHDGRFETLESVVKFMAHFQAGKIISEEEIDAIVSFLKTLTGKIPNE